MERVLNREELIAYIRTNDRKFKYENVNLSLCTDEELIYLKKRIDEENKKEQQE